MESNRVSISLSELGSLECSIELTSAFAEANTTFFNSIILLLWMPLN